MCKVGELNKSEKSIVIKLKNGCEFASETFFDDNTAAAMATNATEKELDMLMRIKKQHNIKEEDVIEWYIKRKREEDTYYISAHAMERLKERNGWNKKTAMRMIKKIVDNGIKETEVKGYLGAWIKEKKSDGNMGDEFIMYGDMFYVFNNNTLITCLFAPNKTSVIKQG